MSPQDKINLCAEFIEKFEDDNDEEVIKIKELLSQLKHEESDKQAYQDIENASEDEKLKYCNRYLSQFSNNGSFLKEVNEIKEKYTQIKANKAAFLEAKEIDTIEGYEHYLTLENCQHELEARQRIGELKHIQEDDKAFEEAKKINTIEEFEEYLRLKNPLHSEEAHKNIEELKHKKEDNTAFEKAKEINTVEAYETYLKGNNPLHREEAQQSIEVIFKIEEDEKNFQLAKKEDTIQGYIKYLVDAINEEYKKFANIRVKELKDIQEDEEDFVRAIEIDTEEEYLAYIRKYQRKRSKTPQVTERLRNLQLGYPSTGLPKLDDEVSFVEVITSSSIVSLQKYLDNYPESRYKDQILKKIKEIKTQEEKERVEKNKKLRYRGTIILLVLALLVSFYFMFIK